jgi:hypothetical protein
VVKAVLMQQVNKPVKAGFHIAPLSYHSKRFDCVSFFTFIILRSMIPHKRFQYPFNDLSIY